jgi:hypothetical protein
MAFRERAPNFVQPRVLLELAKKPAHGYEHISLKSHSKTEDSAH